MNVGQKLSEYFHQLKKQFRASEWPQLSAHEEPPLRAELFSADQMAQYGKTLAASHPLASGRAADQLLPRLAANEATLVEVCKLLTSAVSDNLVISPAGEWLLDNFYLIEEQIRTAKRHLPKDYSRELPRLSHGASAGRPRVYDIALEAVAHGDGRIDGETLSRFVAAYQTITPLKIGELWAIPIMLRLAVIENLRRVAVQIAAGWVERSMAGSWADKMAATAESDPKNLILVIADMAHSNPPMVSAFVAELVRRLKGRGPALALPLTWIEQSLAESGVSIDQLVQAENQQQAADQVSISNSIGSLRVLGAMDWRAFVETMSVVEQILREDPAGVYAAMDFATRDRYRHATEALARKGGLSEVAVARQAVDLAGAGQSERTRHVGYYLIDKGLPALEATAELKFSLLEKLQRTATRHPLFLYLGAIALLTAIFAAGLMLLLPASGMAVWAWLPMSLLVLLATSQLALALVNWLSTLLVSARPLPRMDFSKGIPPAARTLVIVPTLLSSAAAIEELAEALEVRFLANRDDGLHFGLLTDFCDAAQETLPEDAALLALAEARIGQLNAKYQLDCGQPGKCSHFFLFHRARCWNAAEGVWMGYERKRGKLAALNALLRGGGQEAFALVLGEISGLSGVNYVITLDTDTQLPRDTARQFVGAMAHPLNRPHYDPEKGRVTEGYGILQPRVAISLPGSNRSRFARLYGGELGIDPYTRAVSDVYQDVFGEGSFIGKGIYDVDAFEQALAKRFPDNRILSHDLIEGCYARAGLLSDVELFEDYPARYSADVNRRYRWIRGDWQLTGWLRRHVPGCDTADGRQRNLLSRLAQWKLIDNLRRSLLPAALVLLLLTGWLFFPAFWGLTATVIGILVIPPLAVALLDIFRKPDELLLRQHFAAVISSLSRHAKQLAFELACLPYEAFFSLAAVTLSVWRVLVSQRHLLEWNPSGELDRKVSAQERNSLAASFGRMWVGPLLALAVALYLAAFSPEVLSVAGPVLLLWLSSPALAWWLSRPLLRREARLSVEQLDFLHTIARRTWAFFDNFVGADDNWLPPDNFQEYRVASIAHRTSPTNIGMALLANLAAYDFGYILGGILVDRSQRTLATMARLERFNGHFYNWYDTQTLQPLLPKYISTVDSGNLAGHLLTLRAGLQELLEAPILPAQVFSGLSDSFEIVADSIDGVAAASMGEFRKELSAALKALPRTLITDRLSLTRLAAVSARLVPQVASGFSAKLDSVPDSEAIEWAQALDKQCQAALGELYLLLPWLFLPSPPVGLEACWEKLLKLAAAPGLRQISMLDGDFGEEIATRLKGDIPPAQRDWLNELLRRISEAALAARSRMAEIELLIEQAGDFAAMEYDFLYDGDRHLLTIGCNVVECRVDSGYYDLLASEARLCNFVAIAQGKLPQESWFTLGRLLTATGGEPVLLSWSGSMFEYLMPMLVMPSYDNTLLDQTCKAAVARQIEYGSQRGVPWGISESGYNTVDLHLNYQYRPFGVPGLGLKRGLADDLVVAPYASALALMVAPEAACLNLQRLAAEGFVGKYGFFEAIDYTPARQRRGQTNVVVRSFMAHHQGMSLLALAYLLRDRPMQRRFAADRLFQAVMLLLQERVPKTTALFSHTAQLSEQRVMLAEDEKRIRVFTTPDTPMPEVQLLSNGRYHVMLSNAGGGYSRWKDLAVTRWREDGTCDNWGSFCYIREVASGKFWSTAHQPTLKPADSYEAIFSEGRAEFRRRDAVGSGDEQIESYTEIVVSPEDDIELRRLRLTNRSRQRREIEVTSYAEVVIAPPAADALHPAFSNLFVQTEILRERRAILCTRRPRSRDEQSPWMLHLMVVHGAEAVEVSYETDRSRFIGRTRTSAAPQALIAPGPLSGSDGSVLDPIVAIRYRIMLEPQQVVTLDMVSGLAESREMAVSLVDKYQDRHLADRVFDLAWTHSQVVLRQLNASEAETQLHARLASSVIYANAALRADAGVLIQNRRGQSGLWGYAISGDLPIVLLQIADATHIDLVHQLVQAHAYWRMKGLAVDLVIWNEEHAGYRQRLQEQIMGMIASGIEASVIDRPGGIFVRPAEQISGEDRILLQAVARAIISDSRGTLAEQLDQRTLSELRLPPLTATRQYRPEVPAAGVLPGRELILSNGLGGFTTDGHEYVIALRPGQTTPAPWANVLANPDFGTVISESGVAYTWSENAHEFRLTPWHNDPVSDLSGEALYLRDEETGHFWSPSPLPARAGVSYVTRHGFGYSVFETEVSGISSELWVYVAIDAAVKFSLLKIRNKSGRPRQLSATGYVEWVLGDLAAKSAMHVVTEIAPESGALYARNPFNAEFAERVAFFDVDVPTRNVSGDRSEFIGRNRNLKNPAALHRTRLSGKVGAGFDPCAAIQVNFELADGQARDIVFRLGVGRNTEDANQLVKRHRGVLAARAALEAVWAYWNQTLASVQVETPDPALNVMANGWLLYQTQACRLWARSGYYQSGGAFGFRDQLQDVMALVHAQPGLVRAHLLLAASRQFLEGDVQHWWHPPSGRGVRTLCSDDYLWLPLAVCRYVSVTGDTGVLDEATAFLEGRPVKPEDDSYYDLPCRSPEVASLYEHCVRAIRYGLRFGEHGLPLMRGGDWNDGMNRVGIQGRGESVWLGFFLCEIFRQFAKIAEAHGDAPFGEFCATESIRLRQNIEQHAWDGAWYRRAYFDDGTPLGSASNEECRIDSISQSWSVLSSVTHDERAHQAMQSVDEHLVRRDDALIQLLDPPFNKSAVDPGYIRGYVPGVRENGGQYTHGAVWAAMAFAALGDSERAWKLFNIINPVNHARSTGNVAIYKAEPYVVAADLYALPPHIGRAGWTWYSGAAGWTYRLILESLLGLRREGEHLYVTPCLPEDWSGYKINYRYRSATYEISVIKEPVAPGASGNLVKLIVDEVAQGDQYISLVDDQRVHRVQVVMG